MPKVVEVPGVGNVEFPDSMNDEQVSAAIRAQSSGGAEKPGILSDVGDTLKQYWDKINPVSGAQSVAQAVTHPIDTAKAYGEQNAKLADAAKESFKKGEYSQALRHTLSYFLNGIPGIGSALDEAGNKAGAGDIKGAIADTAALATNIAGPKITEAVAPVVSRAVGSAAKATGEATAQRLMKSAIKPGPADVPEWRDIPMVLNTALKNEIPVTEAGANKLQALVADYAQKTKAAVDARALAGYTVDPGAVASRLDQINTASALPEKEVASVNKAKAAFLARKGGQPIPFDVAQEEKQGSYRKVGSTYGERSAIENESEKNLARGLMEEIHNQAPEVAQLDAKTSEFLSLQPALERAVRRAGNSDVIDLKGAAEVGAGGGLGLVARVLDYPGIKSKLAIAINKGSQRTAAPLSMAQSAAKAAAVLNQLSILSRGETDQQQPSGTGAK